MWFLMTNENKTGLLGIWLQAQVLHPVGEDEDPHVVVQVQARKPHWRKHGKQ